MLSNIIIRLPEAQRCPALLKADSIVDQSNASLFLTPEDEEAVLTGWDLYRARSDRVDRVCRSYNGLLRSQNTGFWKKLFVAYDQRLACCVHGKVNAYTSIDVRILFSLSVSKVGSSTILAHLSNMVRTARRNVTEQKVRTPCCCKFIPQV